MRSLHIVFPLLLVLAGCADPSQDGEVTGPYTGPLRRFVVTSFDLPINNSGARLLGDDLNGDRTVDNQAGMVIATLKAFADDLTTHGPDMIASGALASSLELQANDLVSDPSVSVRYRGADSDPGSALGGAFVAGAYASNRTRETTHRVDASIRLPLFVDADPTIFPLTWIEIDLTPDGVGGYDGLLRGGIPGEAVAPAVHASLVQMFATRPDAHRGFLGLVDRNGDFDVTVDEVAHADLLASLIAPDIRLHGDDALSLGFGFHLAPCASGTCASGAPADTCHDRVKDGDESDVDCGGSCLACTGDAACALAADCASGACDQGTCRAASCSDGVRDGYETDVDCGGTCGDCALGKRCWSHTDCATGRCSNCGTSCYYPSSFGQCF